MSPTNQTEKKYRDNQTNFGHIHNAKNLSSWLKETYSSNSNKERRYRRVAEKFLNNKHELKVLEVAAGVGDFTIFCTKLFPNNTYYANELSDIQLGKNITSVADYFNVKILPQISFEEVEKLHFPDNTFDIIFIKAAVHHFEDPILGFKEMHRVLKKNGKLVCFEEPACLNIPLYKTWKKRNNCLEERKMGVNEHIYTVSEYLSFGKIFSKRNFFLDEELVFEYDKQNAKRKSIRKILGTLIRSSSFVFRNFMMWRFTTAVTYTYQK